MNRLRGESIGNKVILLIGNKSDLEATRAVPTEVMINLSFFAFACIVFVVVDESFLFFFLFFSFFVRLRDNMQKKLV